MAFKRDNPGCPCCGCFDETFTNDYLSFAVADGEFVVGSPSTQSRWVLAEGEALESGERGVGESWFHTIEFRGGSLSPGERFDLEWDGITLEVRDLDGTITNGTHSSIFVPKASHPDALIHYKITLWVTPSWYAVAIIRPGLSRGSVQVIDRDNSSASNSLRLTAVTGGLNIVSWRIADSTVSVSGGYAYGEITRECPKPVLEGCTERFHQTQVDLLESLSFATIIDLYNYSGGECVYSGTQENNVPLRNVVSNEPVTTYGVAACGFGGYFGFNTLNQYEVNPRVEILGTQRITVLDSEAWNPYPKPVSRYYLGLDSNVGIYVEPLVGIYVEPLETCDPRRFDSVQVDVAIGSDSKAPVQLNLEMLNLDDDYWSCFSPETCAAGKGPGMPLTNVLVDITVEWVAE